FARQHHRGNFLNEVRRALRNDRRSRPCSASNFRYWNLVEMSQCKIYDFTISPHYFRSTFAVSLLNRFLDVPDRFFTRQDSADAEEAGLHDRIYAPAHPDILRKRVSIDRKKADLFLDYLLLHLTRESIPN